MAHDAYRNPPDQTASYEYSDPRMRHYSTTYNSAESYRPKSRQSSRDRGEGRASENAKHSQPQPPIDEAATSKMSDKMDAASVNPELIAQITETVIKQLRTSTLNTGNPVAGVQQQYPPQPPLQPVPQSPSTQSGHSPPMPRNVYTPPSPHKHSDYPSFGSPESQSPIPHAAPPSPKEPSFSQFDEKGPASRLSTTGEASNLRPKGPTRLSTSKEETTLEKIWGPLFDEQNRPTVRLGQFLRGLAVHLIEDYEPCHSIVITPTKMAKYYGIVRLPTEAYPWSVIFDDRETSISRMYRELECQHHLVQEHPGDRPDIPGLTPMGFERWATLLIQAHPEEEFERLKKAVLEMPISNPDDKKERFPKDISRRLFPGTGDRTICNRIQKAMVEHAHITLPKQTSTNSTSTAATSDATSRGSPPNFQRHSSSTSTESASHPEPPPPTIERERKPYSTIPSECAIDDTNIPTPTTTQPIERERKPYRSQPGGGRVYEDEPTRSTTTIHSSSSTNQPHPHPRSNSTATTRPPVSSTSTRPAHDLPLPEIHHHHRGSTSTRRRHSPSSSAGANDFRRSDSDLRGYQPSGLQSSSTIPVTDPYDEERRHARDAEIRRAEYARRQADEDAGKYGASPGARARYEGRLGSGASEEEWYRGGRAGGAYEYGGSYGSGGYR